MSSGSPAVGDGGGGTSHGIFGSSGIGGFGYGVGVSVVILLAICSVAFAVYFCRNDDDGHGDGDVELGVEEATLRAWPAVAYGETTGKQRRAGGASACCPICLESYAESDVLRALPGCGHLLHRDCVDPWLRQRPTCPVCRTSPLPSPMPTPLAEVTPLALSR